MNGTRTRPSQIVPICPRMGDDKRRPYEFVPHWLLAIYYVATARKWISSVQLAKHLGICQKAAWYVVGLRSS